MNQRVVTTVAVATAVAGAVIVLMMCLPPCVLTGVCPGRESVLVAGGASPEAATWPWSVAAATSVGRRRAVFCVGDDGHRVRTATAAVRVGCEWPVSDEPAIADTER
jgi:hypothetical protein